MQAAKYCTDAFTGAETHVPDEKPSAQVKHMQHDIACEVLVECSPPLNIGALRAAKELGLIGKLAEEHLHIDRVIQGCWEHSPL